MKNKEYSLEELISQQKKSIEKLAGEFEKIGLITKNDGLKREKLILKPTFNIDSDINFRKVNFSISTGDILYFDVFQHSTQSINLRPNSNQYRLFKYLCFHPYENHLFIHLAEQLNDPSEHSDSTDERRVRDVIDAINDKVKKKINIKLFKTNLGFSLQYPVIIIP